MSERDIEDIMPQMPETQGFLEIYGVPICLDLGNAISPWIIALIVIICLITVGKVLQWGAIDSAMCLDLGIAIWPWIIALSAIICLIIVGKFLLWGAGNGVMCLDLGIAISPWIIALYVIICLIYMGAIGYAGYWILRTIVAWFSDLFQMIQDDFNNGVAIAKALGLN